MKTPITYYGGKQQLLKHILPLVPLHSIYTESFAGGLALFFSKNKVRNEIINDTNGFVSNFYTILQSDFENLKSNIEATPYSRVMYNVAWVMYQLPQYFTDLQRACAFYILTNLGYCGRIGSFACYTQGARATGWERKKELLTKELKERMYGVQIECCDALDIIRLRDSAESFHYIDPPYFNSNMGHYDNYSVDDFEKLLKLLTSLKGKFLLSSYPSDLLTKYTKECGWYTKEISTRISSSKNNDGTQKQKIEVLTANYAI